LRDQQAACSIESIQKIVSDYFQIKLSDLKSQRRVRSLVEPRQIAMYLCKKHLHASFPEIGHKFGGKDHTTVMHAVRKIEAHISKNAKIRDDVAFLEKSLKN
jgi:chromosomal replication initiator protein